MIVLLTLMAFDVPTEPKCVIDVCESKICTVETPEGWVEVQRKPSYYEGMKIECHLWLVEPT